MIEIEYIVKDRNGVERLRTNDKKAADAYDKALENADRLAQMLRDDRVLPELSDADLEELTIYLSRNAKNVERILKGKEPEAQDPQTDADLGSGSNSDSNANTSPDPKPASKAAKQTDQHSKRNSAGKVSALKAAS